MDPATRPTSGPIVEYFQSHPAPGRKRSLVEAMLEYPERAHDTGVALRIPRNGINDQSSKNSMLLQDMIIALIGPTGRVKATSSMTYKQSAILIQTAVDAILFSVDTAGFDDTERTDYQVLEQIANWLKETYEEHITLTGLLFFHRITDVRMRGTPLRNLTMFEALCGQEASVVLTTTLWDEVHPQIGEARERELREEFWGTLDGQRPLLKDSNSPYIDTRLRLLIQTRLSRNYAAMKSRRHWKGRKALVEKTDNIMVDARETDVVIPVMGPTGVGKSTFINNVIGTETDAVASVGHDLKSHTAKLQHFVIVHPKDPTRRLVLVDTPGFDDTYVDDSEILRRIAVWLAQSYSDRMTLAGVNLEMFRELCGDKAVTNVVLATTKWADVPADVGDRREQQLKEKYWDKMLKLGSHMMRLDTTSESAWKLINHILENKAVDQLLIQEELVDLQRILPETAAGRALRATLQELLANQEKVAEKLKQSGDAEGDGRLRQTFEENQRKIQSIIHQIQRLKIPASRRFLSFLTGRG
ncbi:putative 50S ribosome-binding GTPase [Lyophyllum shimeji]|uniref:50S ribosome-binding GTPase n=1 Tax=Lyophyllum shimeji TaxID=47721 RepID=A0A9P3PQD2_LYOSH|nr:putative 50S ribosome-binding GTPase [Lyophyllum shimeji]